MRERNLTVPVTAHIPLAEIDAVEAAARAIGISRAAFMKLALREAVARTIAAAEPQVA